MSSHHVVREQQEPALIIADISDISLQHLQPLLEWSPTILVLQDSIDVVLSWRIKIDGIAINDDKLPEIREKVEEQQPLQLLTTQTGNRTIDVALEYLIERNYESVNIIGDEVLLFPLLDQYVSNIQLVIYNKTRRSYYVAGQYSKWVTAQTRFNIFPENENVETNGLQIINDLFVSVKDGIIEFNNRRPFWVIEYL